jgi:para-aminobenzoate synthetase component 1
MKTRIALNGNDGHWRIGIGETARWESHTLFDWEDMEQFLSDHRDRTCFVLLSYELRKQIYPLSDEPVNEPFPLIRLWIPESVYVVKNQLLCLEEGDAGAENETLARECFVAQPLPEEQMVAWKPVQPKADYVGQLHQVRDHIQRGDIYEVNYCQEFTAENVSWPSILPVYQALNAISEAPYSLCYESERWMIASASPERFLRKQGNVLLSQPIKGTARRGTTEEEDHGLRHDLRASLKDRTENVMIVDLVRNDLSRLAKKGSVRVDELFGIYTFPTVHQMISTVSCELKKKKRFSDILQATFPMGSMTGAPKVAAMQVAERTERFTRGMYSGSAGYISPDGDFDLNVMIRSLVYDRENKRASCGVGGAITIFSEPEEEYRECRIKVGRILETVGTCQW